MGVSLDESAQFGMAEGADAHDADVVDGDDEGGVVGGGDEDGGGVGVVGFEADEGSALVEAAVAAEDEVLGNGGAWLHGAGLYRAGCEGAMIIQALTIH